MSFTSSFLDNSFEAQVGTLQHQDALGNIFDANGNHIGVKQGSVADIGSKGTMETPTATSSGTQTPTDKITLQGKLGTFVDDLTKGQVTMLNKETSWLGHQLEDLVFIVVGLILIAAAVFSFKQTQDLAVMAGKEFTKAAIA